MRIGADTYPLRQGDFVAWPTGGPEAAQQIVNTGQDELRYLAASTQRAPEIWEYSDSGGDPSSAFPFFGRTAGAADYWER